MNRQYINKIFHTRLKGIKSDREIDQLIRIYYEDKILNQFNNTEDIDLFIHDDLLAIINGKPIQYVVGKAYFYDGYYIVNESTLIPRPETEELIYWILSSYPKGPIKVLDIGTGTGCIAITIKKHIPDSEIIAIDVAEDVLNTAQQNAEMHDVKIQWKCCDFTDDATWENLGLFDLIISNPPYISMDEKEKMSTSTLEFEPYLALFSIDDPLLFYKKIAEFGNKHLLDKGSVFVELNEYRYREIQDVFLSEGYSNVELKKDLQDKYRMARVSK